ncbi:MAG: monovalent cation/H(+) antiporter subunit G [Bryobacterales bacterium]|nr:monovalent cation/H(+) antiporter subunit G [Bryobacterales bacterium]
MSVLVTALIALGLFFLVVAAVGMVRLPDVFARSHAVALTDALGAFFLLVGLAIYDGFSTNTLRILVVLALLYLVNPVVSHATVRAALRTGEKPVGEDRR